MFQWLTNYRRKKLTAVPFPPDWEKIVKHNVAHYCMLEDAERAHLCALIQVFIAEKDWEGCGGLTLTDEIRVTISAQACLLLLNLPHNYYQNVESIIVYPSTVVPPQRKPGFFETAIGFRYVPVNISGSGMMPNTARNLSSLPTARQMRLNSSPWPPNNSSINP